MTLTKAGMMCDVCDHFILLDPEFENFSVKGVDGMLQCHLKCKQTLIDCGKDWTKLPESRLRKAFEEVNAQAALKESDRG